MNRFITLFLQVIVTINISAIAGVVSLITFNQTFLNSIGYSIMIGVLTYWTSTVFLSHRFLKKHQLTRKEYQYIKKNMEEAKPKLVRLRKALLSMKHLLSLKQRIELIKITRKIYNLTKNEPKRFYLAEQFYFSHLDSALELSEKYVFISGQPKKDKSMELTLYETRRTLEELTQFIEKDLYHVISDDINELQFELDVAKHSIKNKKDSQILKESGNVK